MISAKLRTSLVGLKPKFASGICSADSLMLRLTLFQLSRTASLTGFGAAGGAAADTSSDIARTKIAVCMASALALGRGGHHPLHAEVGDQVAVVLDVVRRVGEQRLHARDRASCAGRRDHLAH